MSVKLKTSYRASSASLYPTYTGGVTALTQDGSTLISAVGDLQDGLLISDIQTGRRLARVKGDGSSITAITLAYHTSPPTLISAHQSGLLRYYPLDLPSLDEAEASTTSASQPPYLSYTRQIPRPHASSPILILSTSPDSTLFTSGASDGSVKVWDVGGGFVTHSFRGHGGPISALCWDMGSGLVNGARKINLITASTDCKLRIFDLLDPSHRNNNPNAASSSTAGKPVHVLDGHVSTPRGIDITPDGKWMISGGRDRVVLVWDMQAGGFNAVPTGISHAGSQRKKASSSTTAVPKLVQTILTQESLEAVGLVSPSSKISVSHSTGKAVFAGKKVLLTEEEAAGDREERLLCYTGGEKGKIRLWDVLKAKSVGVVSGLGQAGEEDDVEMEGAGARKGEDDEDEQLGLKDILYNPSTNSLLAHHHDQNLVLSSLVDNTTTRQIIGFNDEIIDSIFLSPVSSSSSTVIPDSHLALATNSNLIRVYDLRSGDARLMDGHSDVVLCLDRTVQGEGFASGSKDNSARVWLPLDGGKDWRNVAICEGHAESIGAVVWSQKTDFLSGGGKGKGRFLVTASQDKTVKMWDLSSLSLSTEEVLRPKSLTTLKIHEKDINSLSISPNDALLASGSQDKLIKVFGVAFSASDTKGMSSGSLKLLGTCKGHKRGVWSVKFSPTDRVLASGAADRTIKLWSLDDFTCLKTFEGHTNSVLRVEFLSAGQQIVSTASDGLVKIWNVKEEECVKTLDNHEDKVWSLAISKDEKRIVSAGADSVVTVWEDSTAEELAAEVETKEREVADEQDFNNYLSLRDYRRAIGLALAMGQPGRLLNLFISVHKGRPPRKPTSSSTAISDETDQADADARSITGSASVDEVLRTLSATDLVRLLSYVRSWNARAGTSGVGQRVLEGVFRTRKGKEVVELFEKAARGAAKSRADSADDADQPDAMDPADDTPKVKEDGRILAARKRKQAEIVPLSDWLDGMMPYTERHVQRVERMLRDTYAVDFVLSEMDGLVGEVEVGSGVGSGMTNGLLGDRDGEDVLMLE